MLILRDAGRRVGDRWLWRHLSFALEPGESLGVEGPSGSGKTLLLRALVGLDRLDEGEVVLDERPLEDWDLTRYRCRVLLVPQDPALEEGTVEENLRLPFTFRVHRASGRQFDREQARSLLDRLGAEELLDRPITDLSGGEKQRVGFVRALLLEPCILLLDESTAHVDPGRAEAMERIVEEWRDGGDEEKPGRAAIWISHDAAQLRRVTDRSIRLGETDS